MTVAKKRGTTACVCLSTGLANPAVSWVPLIGARDIKAMRAPGAVFDSSDRGTNVQSGIPTRHKPSLEFDMIWNGGAGMLAIRNAFTAQTPLLACYLDGPPGSGAMGMMGEWAVCGFPMDHPLLDGQKVKITLKPHGNYVNPFDINYTDALTLGTPETPVAKKYGTNASVNDAAHNPITALEDIKLSMENAAEFDASDRAPQLSIDAVSYFIDMVIPTRHKFALEANTIWDSGNAQLLAIKAAFLAQTPLEMWALDGPYATTGSWGVHAGWAVTDFPMDSPLLDGQKIALKFEPHGNSTIPAAFFTK